ncbi:MAG: ATP-binding protein, partial [Chloroflexi bacterium]|nr:ATP-binding protein [Chloroflexota bacterium]
DRKNGGALDEVDTIQASLGRALQDIRSISTGMRLPEIEGLTVAQTIGRAVRAHERRTISRVELSLGDLPEQAALPVKIALYRLIQEALSNAYRHGGGVDQRVRVESSGAQLEVEVSDGGPGFVWKGVPGGGQHLGLTTMRERVESLEGNFRVDAAPGRGTRVLATLPVKGVEDAEMKSIGEDSHGRQ